MAALNVALLKLGKIKKWPILPVIIAIMSKHHTHPLSQKKIKALKKISLDMLVYFSSLIKKHFYFYSS